MEKSYEETKLYDLQILYATDITAEIKLDADRKTVTIMSLGIAGENLKNALLEVIEPAAESILKATEAIAKSFVETWSKLKDTLKPLMYEKMSKKRFMKLLQSEGIQRNEIKKIVANNKEPYTYMRLYQTIDKYKKG